MNLARIVLDNHHVNGISTGIAMAGLKKMNSLATQCQRPVCHHSPAELNTGKIGRNAQRPTGVQGIYVRAVSIFFGIGMVAFRLPE
jgi:hypothetical protein